MRAGSVALARRLSELGHEVSVANSRGPETLGDLAAATGATPVTAAEAARGNGLVVVTIPQRNIPQLPADLFADVGDELVVVDTGNYPCRDRRIDAIEAGMTESRWVQEQLGRPVVKTFNTISAIKRWGRVRARRDGLRSLWPAMIKPPRLWCTAWWMSSGSTRSTPEAWTILAPAAGTPLYAADLDAAGVRRALAEASPERKTEFSASGAD